MWIWSHLLEIKLISIVIYLPTYCVHNTFSFLLKLIAVVAIKTAQAFHLNKLKDHCVRQRTPY